MIDLAIIGGGPGGYVAAERAGAKGLNVVLFEKRVGGVCLNEGCIPTKTLLYSAKVYDYAVRRQIQNQRAGRDVRFRQDRRPQK